MYGFHKPAGAAWAEKWAVRDNCTGEDHELTQDQLQCGAGGLQIMSSISDEDRLLDMMELSRL